MRLLTCPYSEILYGGSKGGGKSDGILGDWTRHYGQNPQHGRGIIFRKTYPQLEQLISRSREIFGRLGWAWKEQKKTWYTPTGATLKFRFVETVKDAAAYQGHEYTFMGFDEVGDIEDEGVVNILRGALRSSKPVTERRLILSGNPMGAGHKWLFRRFISAAPPEIPIIDKMRLANGQETTWSRVFIPALLEDNPKLMQQDPGYELRLKQMTAGKPWLWRALRYGDWTVKREVPGALLTAQDIEKARVMTAPALARVLIGVDPTVKGYDPEKSSEELELELGDDCGIYALGRAEDFKRYILKDYTLKADPSVWAKMVVRAYHEQDADLVVAEANNGGELVRIAIKGADRSVPVELVNAKRGKYTRAEPAALAVRNGELFFVGEHDKLEEEFTTWVPDGRHASPNRIDAVVWAHWKDGVELNDAGLLDYYQKQASNLPPEDIERMKQKYQQIKELMKKGKNK